MREPGIAYASARIWPFSLASERAGYSWNQTSPAQIRLGNGKERQNSVTSEIKSITSIYKMFQTSSCSLHGHTARILMFEQKRA
jgi:hypothetical protein